MIDSFDDVPAFVTVVEAGGFSAAARRLNLSRSAVGKAIARLEGRLGIRLFHRTTRSQSLTDDGQVFHEYCQRALGELRAGKELLESGRKTASGRLRISMPVLFGRLCVAPILTRLTTLHPDLALELDFRDSHVDLVHDGFDLVVRNGPLGGGSGLMTRRVAHERTMVCAAPAYVDRHGMPAGLPDLGRHQSIAYCRDRRTQVWLFPRDDGPPLEMSPVTRLRFDDLGAILDAAVAGFGLAWLPDWLVSDSIRSGRLVQVVHDAASLTSDVHAIWPETPHLPMRVRIAIDALVAGMASRL